jgi:hypothetical protein
MKKILFILAVIGFICSCTQKQQNNPQSDEALKGLPEGFSEFYQKFHEDSLYQLDHILFPFQSRKYETKDMYTTYTWQREDWKIHKALDKNQEGFEREYMLVDSQYLKEIIYLKAGGFGLERRFAYLDTAWYLVKYNEYIQPSDEEK